MYKGRKTIIAGCLLIFGASRALAAVEQDIEYGRAGDVSLLMDISVPDGEGPFPAAILVHGGGWVAGDKRASFRPILKTLAAAEFATFSINYRLAPKYLYPSAVHDVERAVKFISANADRFNIDPTRLVLIGESAGAELADLAALDADTHVAAVVSFYGPSDLSALARSGSVPEAIRKMAGDSAIADIVLQSLRRMSPIELVSKNMPPFLFIHGTEDHVVPFESSEQMCDRMREVGASCEVIPVPGGDHGMSRWERNPEMRIYKQPMIAWLRRTLSISSEEKAKQLLGK